MIKHTKANALKAMREVLEAATVPHDCDMVAKKLVRKGLSFSGDTLYPWLMEMAGRGEINRSVVQDSPDCGRTVFLRQEGSHDA